MVQFTKVLCCLCGVPSHHWVPQRRLLTAPSVHALACCPSPCRESSEACAKRGRSLVAPRATADTSKQAAAPRLAAPLLPPRPAHSTFRLRLPSSCLQVIPASCLRGSGLVLPPEFRDAVVKESGDFTLENGEGKQWACSITRKAQASPAGWGCAPQAWGLLDHSGVVTEQLHSAQRRRRLPRRLPACPAPLQGAHERCDITGGWRVFTADNELQVGDEILVKHKGGRVIQASRGWLLAAGC